MNICVYGASSNTISYSYIAAGEEFGKKLAESGHSMIYGGGANGMMGAFARGIKSGNGKIIGVVPSFLNVDGILFDGCTDMIYTDNMRERKQVMEQRADAFLMTPGGIGTFDEFFEILTLKQLGRHKKPIAVFNVNGYFDSIIKMLEKAVKENFIPEKNLSIFFVSDNPQKITDYFENYVPDDFSPEFLKNII